MPAPGHIRLPSIEGLAAFVAAAELGNFERAAERLHITASAVSKRVGTLEELLGEAVFVRQGRSLVLTPAGREYLPQASQALTLLAAMPQHQRVRQRLTRLRVSSPPTFARQVLVPQLASFTQVHPDIELEVVLSIPMFDRHGVDADVEIRNGALAELGGFCLMRDRILPVASPALLQRLPAQRVPADLAQAPLLRTPIEPWLPWFRAAGLPWPEPDQGPRLVDLGLTIEAALSGQGVALARPTLVRSWLASGLLVRLFDLAAEPAHHYQLMPHVGVAAGAFAQWLQAVCHDLEQAAHQGIPAPNSGHT